jgi:predicted permease
VSLLAVILPIILPIIIIVAAGYGFARYTRANPQPLSRVTTYLFSPCLVFTALVRTDLQAAGGLRLAGLVAVQFAALLLATLAIGRLMRLGRESRSGMAVATVLYNSGNYGLPASLFAFGQEGFRIATVVYVVTALVAYSAGVFLASAGRNAPGRAVADIFRLPLVYAAALGLVFNVAGWEVPLAVWRPLEMMGEAAIPLLLVALGAQLAHTRPSAMVALSKQPPDAQPSMLSAPLGAVAVLRLAASPALAAMLLPAFDITGLAGRVVVLSTAMPTAVNAFLVAAQFESAPAFVASAVLVTTLISFVTVPIVLLWLR